MYRTRVQSRSAGRPTRDDVAKHANISGATVSRVLSGRTDLSISPETRARVLEAAEKLGYRPNPAARALTSGRTGLVGLWMSFDYSRYRGQVVDHLRTVLSQTELALAVTDVDKEYTTVHSFDRPLRVPVDGIIAFDNSASIEAFAREHDRLAPNIPFVSMGAYWSEAQSFVGVDLRAGADEAMEHLLSTGRRRISYMAPWTSDLIDSGPRYEAYIGKMGAAGLPTSTIAFERVSYALIKEALVQRHDAGTLPEAILCMNDDVAIAASYVLEGLGVKTGQDVALVGFDGIEETEHCPCPITTVRQPVEEMCSLTYQFLQSQMNDSTAPPRQRILKPELVIRESTRG
ncbi:LacI family DNA-binding transcriptional regulator [Fimbriimonas ginsengisoli]|uniref:Transcriptional regulator, LacI family n=1 Tax=Fimbriimonas ginsengisoli Gsoil 348 TaxID=661478 RepID=A0A068NJR1_FIMGI|nr:LacI family DNA-binding transcriptional regulator [Fimbriimonas ginsengisoli]AIE83741.1 transcriptional regulator, LacI family [Fimbriimonas ginsengisoli Gsoil 348]